MVILLLEIFQTIINVVLLVHTLFVTAQVVPNLEDMWCLETIGIPMVVETDEEALRKFNGIIKLDIRLLGHGDVMMFVYLKILILLLED